jgi:hypothetical protein
MNAEPTVSVILCGNFTGEKKKMANAKNAMDAMIATFFTFFSSNLNSAMNLYFFL